MSDLVYNTSPRKGPSRFVTRNPDGVLEGYEIRDGFAAVRDRRTGELKEIQPRVEAGLLPLLATVADGGVFFEGTVDRPSLFCRGEPRAWPAGVVPLGAYHLRTGDVGPGRQRVPNRSFEHQHGAVVVGRKKLVNKDVVRGLEKEG